MSWDLALGDSEEVLDMKEVLEDTPMFRKKIKLVESVSPLPLLPKIDLATVLIDMLFFSR